MPAGFQSFTADNYVTQLTNDGVFFSLVTRGVLTIADQRFQEGGNSQYYSLTITGVVRGDMPLLALNSASSTLTWANLQSSDESSVTYRVFSTGNGDIEWFLFSSKDPQPNPSKTGLELRRDDGSLCFASDFPPALPLGIFDNNGYSGLPIAGRKLAHIPIKGSNYQYNSYTYAGVGSCMTGGQPGSLQYLSFGFGRSAISARFGAVSGSWNGRNQALGPTSTGACIFGQPTPQTNQIDQPIFKSLIIDVTNY